MQLSQTQHHRPSSRSLLSTLARLGLWAITFLAAATPLLAQGTDDMQAPTPPQINPVVGAIVGILYFAFIILFIVAGWKIYVKAGQPGWAAIVPIYNIIVLLKIVGRPVWWIILLFVPFVNFIIGILLAIDLAKSFGKGGGFAAGLILLAPIFYLILAFGDARYVGPAAGGTPPLPATA